MLQRIYIFSLLFFCLSLQACREPDIPIGTVATVNGQGVTFRELEARRARLFSARSPKSDGFDDPVLQKQYKYVLGQIIEELLICQYMRKDGRDLAQGQLEAEEKRIRDEYPPGAFEEMLLELAIDEGRWREGLHRRLLVEQFILHVLRPEISITADEVQQYYHEHSADFSIPEQWHFIQITGTDKAEVDKAGKSLVEGKNATAVQQDFFVTIHDIRMGADMLPKELIDALAALQPWQASKSKIVDNTAFRLFVLVEKNPASILDPAEMSKRVEQALADEKLSAVYTHWLQKRLRKANIRLAPALLSFLPAVNATELPFKTDEGRAPDLEPDNKTDEED